MGQIIISGHVYTTYEMNPCTLEDEQISLVADEMKRKEKKRRERDWKQRARCNYRKK